MLAEFDMPRFARHISLLFLTGPSGNDWAPNGYVTLGAGPGSAPVLSDCYIRERQGETRDPELTLSKISLVVLARVSHQITDIGRARAAKVIVMIRNASRNWGSLHCPMSSRLAALDRHTS
jgi:hypothetical protein